jgi:hypothetical protein
VTLSWTKPAETSNEFDKAKRFVIYRSTNQFIDLANANNILSITNRDENTYTDLATEKDSTYFYTVTSLDRLHNESTMSNLVSNDTIKPIVITQNISRTLVNGKVIITVDDIDNGSSDNWGIDSMVLSKTTFDCSNIGENIVTLTVTDKAGNVDSATAKVTIVGSIPEPTIVVSRTDNTHTGLPDNTIALGYGAQSLNLSASNNSQGSEVTHYSWTPTNGLSSTNEANTTFSPNAAGTYIFTVVATNEYGCSASTSVTITVIDVRCGNNKIIVCKNEKEGNISKKSQEQCLSGNAVATHLQNGGKLGPCNNENMITTTDDNGSAQNTASILSAYPNPFSASITVTFTLSKSEKRVALDIYDLNGSRLAQVYTGEAKADQKYNFIVDASAFRGKFFHARLVTPDKVYTFRLEKE